MILVLDIDGTLADISHRAHLIEKENPTPED
jgi:hydroxymethylpyrimidine pyrophosphatase-like HAD family hydrolase